MESLAAMHDPRYDTLARILVEYSTRLRRNKTVLIETFDVPDDMTIALVRAARKAGAIPFAQIYRARVSRELALEATERQLNLNAIVQSIRAVKADTESLRLQNEFFERSKHPLDTPQ